MMGPLGIGATTLRICSCIYGHADTAITIPEQGLLMNAFGYAWGTATYPTLTPRSLPLDMLQQI